MKEKRDKRITVRLTDEEYNTLMKKKQETNFKTANAFIAALLLNGQIIKIDTSCYNNIRQQISGIATNINQIARKYNSENEIENYEINNLLIYMKQVNQAVKELNINIRFLKNELQKIDYKEYIINGLCDNGQRKS